MKLKRKQFEPRFDRVRPGTFYQLGTRDQFDSSSDGTVFVNGDINHDDNYRFRDLSKRLSSHLQEKLPTMFDVNFGPKSNAVWCTLDILIVMISGLIRG